MAVLATDNFNRANANPIGSPWVTTSGESAMQIVSNAATPTNLAIDCGAYYSGTTWPNNQYSKAQLTVNGTAGAGSGACLKVRQASGANTQYRLAVDHAASNNVTVAQVIAGAFTTLPGFPLTQSWTDGDTWELWAVGSQIWVVLNSVLIGSKTTDTGIASGSPGIGYSSTETSASIDNWEGGTVDGSNLLNLGKTSSYMGSRMGLR